VEFGGGHGAGGIIFLFALSDVTHVRDRGDWKVVRDECWNSELNDTDLELR